MKWFFLFLFLAFLSIATYLFFYLGFHKEVSISGVKEREFHFVYKEHFGSYKEINNVIAEVETWARENNINCTESFGRYLDNPSQVEAGRLRSWGGCVVQSYQGELPKNYKTHKLESKSYAVAEFTGSPAIGPIKVYPKLLNWMAENQLKPSSEGSIEIYQVNGKKVLSTYYLPIEPK